MILLPRILARRCARLSSRSVSLQLPNCWKNDIKNFAGWACFRKAKPSSPRLLLNVMFGIWGKSAAVCWLSAVAAVTTMQASIGASDFRFDRDTLAFQNATVLKYKDGVPFLRAKSTSDDPANKYTRHCFVMTRTAMQFRKFRSEERRVGKEWRGREW